MIFLANRSNLDRRTLLTRLHNRLQTQVDSADTSIRNVWYHTSAGNKVGVRAAIDPYQFLQSAAPVTDAELYISFDFPPDHPYDFYKIQWVEPERDLMLGWHQDETHMDLGECHFQIDHRGETVQREAAAFLDTHPLNVFDQRLDHLVELLAVVSWDDDRPHVPSDAIP